jgi:hypothetical protein
MANNNVTKKLLDLFIQTDEPQKPPTPAAPIAPPPALSTQPRPPASNNHHDTRPGHRSEVPALPLEPPRPAPATLEHPTSIERVYQTANIQPAPYTAEDLMEMLETLSELPTIEAKRKAISGLLGALKAKSGVTAQTIAKDADAKRRALLAYADQFSKQTEQFVAEKQQLMNHLKAQIELAGKQIEEAKDRQKKTTEMCLEQADRLEEVEAFLDQDISS